MAKPQKAHSVNVWGLLDLTQPQERHLVASQESESPEIYFRLESGHRSHITYRAERTVHFIMGSVIRAVDPAVTVERRMKTERISWTISYVLCAGLYVCT